MIAAASGATWFAVWVAAALVTTVLGVLLTLPVWRQSTGARLAVGVLTVQAGAVTLGGTVLVAAAVRSWQLVDRPIEDLPDPGLLRLSQIDGDTALFALAVLFAATATVLLTTLSALAARFAAGDDPLERWSSTALLALEAGGAAYLVVLALLGDRSWPVLAGAAALPLLAAAMATCWPTRPAASAGTEHNAGDG